MEAELRRRAGGCCEYCKMPQHFEMVTFEIDHIISQKHVGPTSRETSP